MTQTKQPPEIPGRFIGLPTGQLRRRAKVIFAGYASALLQRRSSIRLQMPGVRGPQGSNGWFKRNAYALLKLYVDSDLEREFLRQAISDGRRTTQADLEANPFKVGLLALASDNSISPSDRFEFGEQFLAAYQAEVEPEWLLAYLSQQGGPQRMIRERRAKDLTPQTG